MAIAHVEMAGIGNTNGALGVGGYNTIV